MKVSDCNSDVVRASPLDRTVPSAFFSEPEVGMAVMEIVKESPSLSVGAERFKSPAFGILSGHAEAKPLNFRLKNFLARLSLYHWCAGANGLTRQGSKSP